MHVGALLVALAICRPWKTRLLPAANSPRLCLFRLDCRTAVALQAAEDTQDTTGLSRQVTRGCASFGYRGSHVAESVPRSVTMPETLERICVPVARRGHCCHTAVSMKDR